jgi:exopolysaccharide biosynthesis polyprenyl glycosylphosphotransferase
MNPLRISGIAWGVIGLSVAGTIFGAARRFRTDNGNATAKGILPLSNYDGLLLDRATKEGEPQVRRAQKTHFAGPQNNGHPASPAGQYSRETLETFLTAIAITGDFALIILAFVLANLLVQGDFITSRIKGIPMPPIAQSSNIILACSAIVLWSLSGKELYSYRSLLLPSSISHKILGAVGFCLLAFAGFALVVRTDPPIPWIFFLAAALIIFPILYTWRLVLSRVIRHPALSSRLRRRLVVIGGGMETLRIQKSLGSNSAMQFVGWVQAIKPNHIAELEKYRLGPMHELGAILERNAVNIAVLTESESLQREGVLAIAKACENKHVQFKMVPHFFEILISGLRPETIGGVRLLGVDCLPLNGHRSHFLKRMVDIVGALIGLTLSIPLIVIFGALVYWESPGPILYKQVRQGRKGRLFHILKLRSMHVNAEAHGKAQWAQQNDHRRLRIGTFMRKWNIDEVPQFWNVLKGEMSLVGPRPERPELIARFKSKIPHYQARHMYRPGMTGWAQVNGWRGNTDLEERVRHDIWYLENWSVWLDLRIMAQTFFRQKNAY